MRNSGPVRILLVEDDEVDRMAVQRLFAEESLPYDLVVAETVAEATARMREGGIDLVLIDQKLPNGCGLDVQREAGGTPHIFITGVDHLSLAVEAMKAGAADFLVKDGARQYLQLLPMIIESTLKQEEHVQARRRAEEALQRAHDELEVQVRERTAQLVSTVDRLVKEVERRKRAEEDLQESEQRYRSLIDDVLDTSATGIFILDAEFKIVWISQAIERYFGLRREEVVGKDKRQVIGERIKDIFEDAECFVEKVFATYQNNVYVEPFECHVLPNGQCEERWLEHSSLPICLGLYAGGRIETYYDITDRKQAEMALRQSEERFRTVIEASKDAMVTINREGLITVFNRAAEEMFGHQEQNILGQPVDCLMPEEYREQHRQGRQGYFTSGEPNAFIGKTVELAALRSDGHVFPVELSLSAAQLGGEPFVLAAIRDITERKAATRALETRARQQEVVAELGRVALKSDDLTDVMNEVIRRVAETLGVEYCNVLELLPGGQALLLRAGVGWKEGYVGRATVPAGQDSQAGYTLLSEGPNIVEDLRAETRFFGQPLLHDHGVVSGMCVIVQGPKRPWGVLGCHSTQRKTFSKNDVNFLQAVANLLADAIARKRVEEELVASETNYHEVFNAVNDIIGVHDKHTGAVLDVNDTYCRVFGFTRDEARQLVVGDFSLGEPPYSQEDIARWVRKAVEEGPQLFEWLCKKKSGELFWVEVNLKLAVIGGEDRVLAVVRDISERKRAEEERENLIATLEAQNAELERFTYTVSHDLKSPLITLKGYMGVLKQDLAAGDGEAIEDDVSRMAIAADKMAQLLNELLELSRIGRVVNPPEDVALGEIAGEAVELVGGRITQGGVQVEIAPDTPVIFGDRSRLVEVLQNLIENAVKCTADQPDPRIIIGARQDNRETVCYVRDNGMGIDPLYHQKIFGLFEKLDSNSDGTGVGLALVKRIVEVHGGRIWVESEGVGHGSTFCFTLPQRTDSTECGEVAK